MKANAHKNRKPVFVVFVWFVKKMLVANKRKLVNKTLKEKCAALKDLEKGVSNKDVAAKYGVPKNTISTWAKSKDKLFSALEKGSNILNDKNFVKQTMIVSIKLY